MSQPPGWQDVALPLLVKSGIMPAYCSRHSSRETIDGSASWQHCCLQGNPCLKQRHRSYRYQAALLIGDPAVTGCFHSVEGSQEHPAATAVPLPLSLLLFMSLVLVRSLVSLRAASRRETSSWSVATRASSLAGARRTVWGCRCGISQVVASTTGATHKAAAAAELDVHDMVADHS